MAKDEKKETLEEFEAELVNSLKRLVRQTISEPVENFNYSNVRNEIEYNRDMIRNIINKINYTIEMMQIEFLDNLYRDYPSDVGDKIKRRRFFPISFYREGQYGTDRDLNVVADENESKSYVLVLKNLSELYEFDVVYEVPTIHGSRWDVFVCRVKSLINGREAREIFDKSKRALELAGIEKVQSEVTKNKAEAAKYAGEAIGTNGNAVLGDMVIEKYIDENGNQNCIIRELTQEQMVRYKDALNARDTKLWLQALESKS